MITYSGCSIGKTLKISHFSFKYEHQGSISQPKHVIIDIRFPRVICNQWRVQACKFTVHSCEWNRWNEALFRGALIPHRCKWMALNWRHTSAAILAAATLPIPIHFLPCRWHSTLHSSFLHLSEICSWKERLPSCMKREYFSNKKKGGKKLPEA